MDVALSEKEPNGFQLLSHGHKDMVEATAFNSYGDRFATSSVDGRIKVYNRHKDNTWNLCDTWGAHTAEITQVSLVCAIAERPLTQSDTMVSSHHTSQYHRIHCH
jgi:WD40 repeat protein